MRPARIQLDKADAALHQTPRHQALPPEDFGALVVQAVEFPDVFRLIVNIGRFGGGRLHTDTPVHTTSIRAARLELSLRRASCSVLYSLRARQHPPLIGFAQSVRAFQV